MIFGSIDLIIPILDYVEYGEYLIWASVCKSFRKHLAKIRYPKFTNLKSITVSIKMLEFSLLAYPPFTDDLCAAAISNNNFGVMREVIYRGAAAGPKSYNMAVRMGNFEILEILHAKKVKFDSNAPIIAIKNRDYKMVVWLSDYHNFKKNPDLCTAAAEINDIELIMWLNTIFDCGLSENMLPFAVENKNYNLLEYLRLNNVRDYCGEAILKAGDMGDFDMVKYLHLNFGSVHEELAAYAARRGYLEIVKWAIDNDFGYYYVAENAAATGQLHILIWMKENNIEIVGSEILATAAHRGHLEIVKWATANYGNYDISYYAAIGNHVEILEWYFQNYGIKNTEFINEAVAYGYREIIEWAIGKKIDIKSHFENEIIVCTDSAKQLCKDLGIQHKFYFDERNEDELNWAFSRSLYYENYIFELVSKRRYNLINWLVNNGMIISKTKYKKICLEIPAEIHSNICRILNFNF